MEAAKQTRKDENVEDRHGEDAELDLDGRKRWRAIVSRCAVEDPAHIQSVDIANGAVLLCRMKRRSARCDRLLVDSRAAAQAIAVASEAGQGQQQLVQQGRSAMTPPRPAAMDGAEPNYT